MEKSVSDRIRKMAEYLDEEHIARTLGIPADVVSGVLKGVISEELLEGYDPARPPDIKVIEKPKFVRTRVIGVVSPFGIECAEFVVNLAKESASRVDFPVLLIDFSEFSYIDHAVRSKPSNYIYCTVTAYKFSKDIGSSTMGFPGQENLFVMFGCPTTVKYLELAENDIADLLKAASESAELVWVNFPISPRMWSTTADLCDHVLCLVKDIPDHADMVRKIMPALARFLHKTALVGTGAVSLGQIRRVASQVAGEDVAVLGTAAEDVGFILDAFGIEAKRKKGLLTKLFG